MDNTASVPLGKGFALDASGEIQKISGVSSWEIYINKSINLNFRSQCKTTVGLEVKSVSLFESQAVVSLGADVLAYPHYSRVTTKE